MGESVAKLSLGVTLAVTKSSVIINITSLEHRIPEMPSPATLYA
jgi:hypothetical protein